jgi:hypothetical protein
VTQPASASPLGFAGVAAQVICEYWYQTSYFVTEYVRKTIAIEKSIAFRASLVCVISPSVAFLFFRNFYSRMDIGSQEHAKNIPTCGCRRAPLRMPPPGARTPSVAPPPGGSPASCTIDENSFRGVLLIASRRVRRCRGELAARCSHGVRRRVIMRVCDKEFLSFLFVVLRAFFQEADSLLPGIGC